MEELLRPYFPALRKAAARKERLALRYRRGDGKVVTHHAVYPRRVFSRNGRVYLEAYCVPPRDRLTFRVERILGLHKERRRDRLARAARRAVALVRAAAAVIRRASPALVGLAGAILLAIDGATGAAALVLLAVLVVSALYVLWTLSGGNPKGRWSRVTRVIDGDTVGVGRGWRYTKVRLIGVDSPETVHPDREVEPFGPEASAFTKNMLSGRTVYLELDHRRLYDRHGRLRAYVFTIDGKMVNRELVERGYARVVDTVQFRYYRDFKRREEQARKAGVGMWAGR